MSKDLTLHSRDQQIIRAVLENNADLIAAAREKTLAAMPEAVQKACRRSLSQRGHTVAFRPWYSG